MESETLRITCQFCKQSFTAKKSLYRHQRRIHNLTVVISGKNKCHKCDLSFLKHVDLVKHIKIEHDGGDEEEPKELHFSHLDEFYSWKEEEEKSSKAKFSMQNGTYSTSIGSRNIFHCHRFGEYKTKGLGLRPFKTYVSCKAGFVCTARIETYVHEDGIVSVLYYSKHRGHGATIDHKTTKEGTTAGGDSSSHIPESICDESEVSGNMQSPNNIDHHNNVDSVRCNKETQARAVNAKSEDLVQNGDPFSAAEYFVGLMKSCDMEKNSELKSEFNKIIGKAIEEGQKLVKKYHSADVALQQTVKIGSVKKSYVQQQLLPTKKSKNLNGNTEIYKPTNDEKLKHMDLLGNEYTDIIFVHIGDEHTY